MSNLRSSPGDTDTIGVKWNAARRPEPERLVAFTRMWAG